MPRLSRVVVPGCAHHVTQRGVRSIAVFDSDDDRELYLRLLRFNSVKYGLGILGYCLMTNHVHIVVIPDRTDSLALGIGETHRCYTNIYNGRHGVKGYLFQGRFYSCPMDARHTFTAMAYVERNPVRAGIAVKAWDYRWSSAGIHTGRTGEKPFPLLPFLHEAHEWEHILAHDPKMPDGFKDNFRTGWPLGNEKFLEWAEKITGRRLHKRPAGRPAGFQRGEIGIMSPN
jgi:putative transposase